MNETPAPPLLFLFDMDDVLVRYDWRTRMAGLSELTGHDFVELRRRWWDTGSEQRAEAGHFADGDEYLAAFREAMGCEVDETEWARVRGAAMTELPERVEAVRIAKEHGRVALLTNNGPLAGRWLHEWVPSLPPLFGEHLDTSSNFGARKPEQDVFRRVLEHHGVPAERTFFADDMPENVAGARSVGITAVLVEHDTDLRDAVRTFIAAHETTSVTPDAQAPDAQAPSAQPTTA
ncbi:HAD family hydrolase [Curtobacterium herbarum]|uniref:HAD family hydrolase n=1 Tax=Curtobacterium herbarum TaxID=150122 RepID=UPI00217EB87B|nr:HAD family phosphatase [Curtobacterium herbarum]MBM7475224.1 putative hydrolase of the HAD superfamily [Curtobacterium herbarum]MCS6543140.1 HAD family phosphatase [Curtobacterium herbarum]